MSVVSDDIELIVHGCFMKNPDCCVEDMFTETRTTIYIDMIVVHEWRSPSVCYKYALCQPLTVYSAELGLADLFRPGGVDFTLERLENLESPINNFCLEYCNVNISHQHICNLKHMLSTKLEKDVRAFIEGEPKEGELPNSVMKIIERKPKEVVFYSRFGVRALHMCADEQVFDENYEEFTKCWGHRFSDPDQVRDPSSSLALLRTRIFSEEDSAMHKSCPVCLEMLPVGREVRETPCAHLYHMHCIRKWFEKENTCPMCRKILCNLDSLSVI